MPIPTIKELTESQKTEILERMFYGHNWNDWFVKYLREKEEARQYANRPFQKHPNFVF